MTDHQHTERGAAEENSGTPVTETERDASRRPPSQPDADRSSAEADDR